MNGENSTAEIIRALRCTSSVQTDDIMCQGCPYCISEEWEGIQITGCDYDRIALDAADRLEQLSAGKGAE